MKYVKLLVGLLILVGLATVAKYILVPILPGLSPETLLELETKGLLKILEFTAVFILVAAFVMQEIVHLLNEIDGAYVGESKDSRWEDLAYVFVLVFGSAGLFIVFSKLAGSI